MSLTPELSKIKHPNFHLIDWLTSIENLERRFRIYLEVGIQLKRSGLPNKKINSTYLQLADKPFVKLEKLTDDKIALFSRIGTKHTTAFSGDEDEYYVVSDNSSSETDSEIQELQENNAIKPLDELSVENKELKESNVEDSNNVDESKDNSGSFNSGEYNKIQSRDSLTPLNALADSNIESTSVTDKPQLDQSGVTEETSLQESLTPLSVLEDRSNEESEAVINKPQIDQSDITEKSSCKESLPPLSALEVSNIEESASVINKPQIDQSDITEKTNTKESLPPLSTLEDSNIEESAAVINKPQIDQSDITERTSFKESLPPLNALEGSNIGESAAVIIKPQIDQNNVTRETSFQESNTVQSVDSSAVKDKLKDVYNGERKSVIEKLEGNSLQSVNFNEVLNVTSEKFSDCNKNKNSNNVQKINSDLNLNNFQLEKQLNDKSCARKSLEKQLEIESCTVKNIKATSKTCEGSKGISNNSGLVNVCEEARTSNMKTKPTINREELLRMLNLKEQIAKNLRKKNVHLPASSTDTPPILTGGKIDTSVQSAAKQTEENGQKPLISVRKNLFEHTFEKSLKHPEVSAMQTNKNSLSEGNNKVSGVTNTNIGLPHFSGSSNKVKEQQKYKEGKSGPLSSSENFNASIEGLKQMNAQLCTIKKIAESRKRLSQDSGGKIETIKKRRFSEQISTSRGREVQKQEEQLKDHSETVTQNKSIDKGRIPLEPTIKYPLDSNVDTCQSQPWNSSETSAVNKPMNTKSSQIVLKESNKSCLTDNSTHNRSSNEERIPQGPIIGTSESLPDSNFDAYKSQPLKITDANAGIKPTLTNSTQIMQGEVTKSSSNMTVTVGQKNSTGRSINKSINNLIRRQSATVLGNNLLLENQQTTQTNTELVMDSMTDSLPENSTGILNVATGSEVTVNKEGTDVSHLGGNRLSVLLNDQSSPQATSLPTVEPIQVAPATSNHPIIGKTLSSDINRFVEKAIHQFLIYFCNRSDENLFSIPSQVRSSLNQYCTYQRRPPFKKLSEYLKLYMVCYIKLFNNEEVSKKISKIAELLHLSIADFHRRNERRDQAIKLQSEVLRREEISRANKDYNDIIVLRGRQFADMFLSVLSNINRVKGCEFLMLVTFYFKITQALTKIDLDNETYVFSLRDLMKVLLEKGRPSLPLDNSPFFKVDFEDFKSNCRFVKQCLLTLYISGYCEVETENFWVLVKHKPIIPNLENMMTETNHGTQTVGSSGTSDSAVTGQMPFMLESLLRADPHQKSTHQIPINICQQTNAEISNSSQSVNQLNIQNTMVQQRTQADLQPQVSQRPSFMVGVRVPSQLPPFASLNQPQHSFQQLSQRNRPASSNIQANPGLYHHANRGVQQPAKNSPSVSSQPQSSGQNVRIASKPYLYPPPQYPGASTQHGLSPQTNQLWQPSGSVNNATTPVNIRVPATNHQNIAENVNVPSEKMLSMPQMCSMPGCSKQATLICSLCREALYCTTACQTQDWYENHSNICLK